MTDDLTSAERDVLWCLFCLGPTQDGNLPSKAGRDSLFEAGWVVRWEGWQALTIKGLKAAIRFGMDRDKEQWQRAKPEWRT